MSQKVPTAEIERQLVERGLAPEAAAEIVQQLGQARADAVKSVGKRNMFYGAVWCIGGTLVIVLTFQSAGSGSTAGRYVIAWGAIAIGALQFAWGLLQAIR